VRYDFLIFKPSGLVNNLGHILHIFKTNSFEEKLCGFAALLLLSTGTESKKNPPTQVYREKHAFGSKQDQNGFWRF
jgi:hypothetical protein